MLPTPSQSQHWRFSVNVLAPVVVALVLTAAAVTWFALWVTSDLDAQALEQQRARAARIVSQTLEKVPHDQRSVVYWDDAVIYTRLTPDMVWVDVNLGDWLHDYYGQNKVLILDTADEPIYAMSDGKAVAPDALDAEFASLQPLVRKLRDRIASGAIEAFTAGTTANLPQVSDVVMLSGGPAVVSVAPMIPNTEKIVQATGVEYLHISMDLLDAELVAATGAPYLLDEPTFGVPRDLPANRASYPVMNANGETLAALEWQPDRPGATLLNRIAPAFVGAFLVGGLIVFLLLHKVWRSARELEAGRAAAQHDATHDHLTGLPNRKLFDHRLAAALQPGDGEDTAVLLLDVDRFKQVNDTLGHQAGDELIRAVGQRLQGIVGTVDSLARLGGDEFALVYQVRGGAGEARALSERMIAAVSKPFLVRGSEVFVGVSVGIALAGSPAADHAEMVRRADIALYEAKSAGGNRAVVYEERMNEALQMHHVMEAELREALRRNDQLSVAFQPQFDQRTGFITGAEALARWRHPKLGLVSPAHFIPVAEASGLIEAIGELVLRRSCELGKSWPGQTIAVNVSPTQLRNPEFPDLVFKVLEETGMRPEDLELEVTENILIEEEEISSEALRSFRSAGIRIALDDFGTGYSSLNYLKRYAVDRIKIDRSFVGQLGSDEADAIVQAMVTLAHAMHIEVTAEGVETNQQMSILTAMGCDSFQGFLLSAPVPPRVFTGMLETFGSRAAPRPMAQVA